jgi:hypothetical protein
MLALTAAAQEVHRLRDVHKVYLAPLAGNAGGIVREQIVGKLVQSGKVMPVDTLAQADAQLTGVATMESQQYYRSRAAIYGGSAGANTAAGTVWYSNTTVRLTAPDGTILWFGEGTNMHARGCRTSATSCAAEDTVKILLKAIDKDKKQK